ncbi:MAG: DNA oxidative demethylase AlkB [Gammaproteobacteria bacterium]|nr:DNA oxidative demethylase AlkB [Gammaproteobacteria bacterium]
MTTLSLFDAERSDGGVDELCPGAMVLRGFAARRERELAQAVDGVARAAPFRHLITPGGYRMSVAMTNCGDVGWISDETGYRYEACDPLTGERWPDMPEVIRELAREAAMRAGFERFAPNACLVNRYEPRARLSLHQDKDEQDFSAPIVSVSLGVPAAFLFGGLRRKDPTLRVPLTHGDVVVWGGPARLRYHGVLALKQAEHPFAGALRYNLTLRTAVT